jgi:hypothetical protein
VPANSDDSNRSRQNQHQIATQFIWLIRFDRFGVSSKRIKSNRGKNGMGCFAGSTRASSKRILLVIALAALGLWPMNRWRWLAVYGTLNSIEPQRVEFFSLTAECSNGWIVIGRDRQRTILGPWLKRAKGAGKPRAL